MDVHLFLMAPGRAVLGPALGVTAAAAWFARAVEALGPEGVEDAFREPAGGTHLARLQRELVSGSPPVDEAPLALASFRADRSLQVHACHGPLREVEALHDALLDLFAADATLCPEDVAVLVTDLETYGPLVDAVFQQPGEGVPAIPYRILDRSVRREGPLVEALLGLLELPGGRLEATRVLGLLDSAALRRRFHLDDEAVETIRGWVRDVGIRWGWDLGAKKVVLGTDDGYEGMGANTWEQGLDRLFLGYAMSERHGPCLEREGGEVVPPHGGVEGAGATALGALREVLEAIRVLGQALAGPFGLGEWASRLEAAVARFFECDEDSRWELKAVQEELTELGRAEGLAGPSPVSLEAVRGHLKDRLEGRLRGRSLRNPGVSFASLRRLRGVPFRVIALVGMNDDAFPGRDAEPSFDEMAAHPEDRRPGDPDPRADDRLLFLETLSLARDAVLVSYVGHDPQDQGVRPPSVVVSELLDHLSTGELVRHHPRSPFHRDYFAGGGTPEVYSYSREHATACRASLAERAEPGGLFAAGPLPAPVPDEGLLEVTPADLARYFRNPAAYLLRRRLGLYLPGPQEGPVDVEPFGLADALQRWSLATEAIGRLLGGMDPREAARRLRADPRMPHGPEAARAVEGWFGGGGGPGELVEFVRRFQGEGLERPLDGPGESVDLPPLRVGEVVVAGRVTDVWEGRAVHRYAYAKGKEVHREKDRLDVLVGVLLVALHGGEATGRLVFRDCIRHCRSSALDARPSLEALVGLYEQGLRAPLPYVEGCSMSYHLALPARGEVVASHEFRRLWLDGGRETPPRRADPYYALAFAEEDPFRDGLLAPPFVRCIGDLAAVLARHES